jgi:DnaJ domain/PilZ domain
MDDGRTYYDILEVSRDASHEVIVSAYRTLMSTEGKHPDLGGDSREAVLINVAYETLSDSKKRTAYDKSLPKQGDRSMSKSPVERRRAPRCDSDATVSYCLDHDVNWHPARVKDMSVLGVRIQSHEPLVSGTHIVIAPSNLASQAFHGTIRWTRMFHPSMFERVYEAGIEFSDQIQDIDQRMAV